MGRSISEDIITCKMTGRACVRLAYRFYQHVPNSVEWAWGLVWGHAYSKDLVTWHHLPIALEPSQGGYDSDGCFSGKDPFVEDC